jgi:hypothetical protein
MKENGMRISRSIWRAATIVAAILTSWSSSPAAAQQHQDANIYAFWDFHGASGFWNVDQHLLVSRKAAASYWAKYWTWTQSSDGGYIGLQTDGNRFDGTVGDTAIFSLWNSNGSSGPACGIFGGEGVGHSCRVAYPIQTGRYYRLRVWRLNADSLGQWWGGWIKDEATGVETYIGSIRVAHAHTLMQPPMNFAEYFGPSVACSRVPLSVVYWTQPAANHLGGGVYEHGSTYSDSARGACTRGGVQPYDFGWTQGVRMIQGGLLNF